MEFDVLAQLFDIRVDKVWIVLFNAHCMYKVHFTFTYADSVIEYWYKGYICISPQTLHFESMFRLVNHVSGNVCARVTWSKSPICISQIRLPSAGPRTGGRDGIIVLISVLIAAQIDRN